MLATTLAFGTDVVYLLATYGGSALICSGMGETSVGPECFEAFRSNIPPPDLGRRTYEGTRTLRCPEIIYEAEALREVAQCYRDKGFMQESEQQLAILENVSIFRDCQPETEY